MMDKEKHLRWSATIMRLVGWILIPALILGLVGYAPGFVWGVLSERPQIGPAHQPSPYDGLHPYVFMLVALYAAWAILLICGADDNARNAVLFGWGILANLLHWPGHDTASLRLPERARASVGRHSPYHRSGRNYVGLASG